MSIILPNAYTANTDAIAANAAAVTAAQNLFVAEVTVLINQAMTAGQFQVQPFLPNLVTSDFVTSYFQPLGYTILFPIIAIYPYNPPFVAGFPEVLPPGYVPWNYASETPHPNRIQIGWSVV